MRRTASRPPKTMPYKSATVRKVRRSNVVELPTRTAPASARSEFAEDFTIPAGEPAIVRKLWRDYVEKYPHVKKGNPVAFLSLCRTEIELAKVRRTLKKQGRFLEVDGITEVHGLVRYETTLINRHLRLLKVFDMLEVSDVRSSAPKVTDASGGAETRGSGEGQEGLDPSDVVAVAGAVDAYLSGQGASA